MELNVTPGADGITRVAVCGEVHQTDFLAADEPLSGHLGAEGYQAVVLVDLSGVTTLDSSGVGWLLLCQKRFRTAGGAFVLHSLSPFVLQLFDVLKMHLVLTIAADEPAALEIARRRRK
jgi:anti-anti-sigma factor